MSTQPTQPEALRLADWLQAAVQIYPQRSEDDPGGYASEVDQVMDEAAAELRRLHALTQSTQPTDDEIKALLPTVSLARNEEPKVQVWLTQKDAIAFARAVLAKWGTPATGGGPVAWLDPWTGTKVTTDYDAYGKHGIPLYASPQPVREPLSNLHLAVIGRQHFGNPIPKEWHLAARDLEAAHGITGGQHDAG